MVRAGELRKRLNLLACLKTTNSSGEEVRTWPPDGGTSVTVWGALDPKSGRQRWRGALSEATVDHLVLIRYRPDIVPGMRVGVGTRLFDVNAVIDPEERHVELELYCSEVV